MITKHSLYSFNYGLQGKEFIFLKQFLFMLSSFSALVSWLSNEANNALEKKETNLLLLSYSLYLTTLP